MYLLGKDSSPLKMTRRPLDIRYKIYFPILFLNRVYIAQAGFKHDIRLKKDLELLILFPPVPVCSDGRHSVPRLDYTELHPF